ncbi:MAG: hypothetical protein M3R38_12640 [Actinomycetota bacterium]|nr:hypothetical protein [Actinomycetota bacterium]
MQREEGVNIVWYDRQRPAPNDQATLTIQKTGIGTINNAAAEALNRPDAIELGFDPEARVIAIKAAAPGSPNAIRVRQQGNSSTREFGIRSFLSFFGIEYEGSRRYPATRAPDGDMLLVDLKEGGVDVSLKGRKKSREEG